MSAGTRCVGHTHEALKPQSWCGRRLERYEWHFMDVDHAIYAGPMASQDRCPACMEAITAAITGGVEVPK